MKVLHKNTKSNKKFRKLLIGAAIGISFIVGMVHVNAEQITDSKKSTYSITDTGTNGTVQWNINSNNELHLSSGELAAFPFSGGEMPWEYAEARIYKVFIDGKITTQASAGGIFENLKHLSQIINLSYIDFSHANDIRGLFENAGDGTLDIDFRGVGTTGNVTTFYDLFKNANLRSINLSGINSSGVQQMLGTFEGTRVYEGNTVDLSGLNTGNVNNMSSMFKDFKGTVIGLPSLNTSNVTTMTDMFNGSNFKKIDLGSINTSKVVLMSRMFANTVNLKSLNIDGLDTSSVQSTASMFENSGLESFSWSSKSSTNNVDESSRMFANMPNLKYLDLTYLNTNQSSKFLDDLVTGTSQGPGQFVLKLGTNTLIGPNSISGFTSGNVRWRNVGSGSEASPNGNDIWSDSQLGANYGPSHSGTYVLVDAARKLTIHYVDHASGQTIRQYDTMSGILGESYDATGKIVEISGYKFASSSGSVTGTYKDGTNELTLQYTKKVPATLTIHYADEDGEKIHDDTTITGNVGDSYDVINSGQNIAISGYEWYGHDHGNLSGTFVDGTNEVTLKYWVKFLKFMNVPQTMLFKDSKVSSHAQDVLRSDAAWKMEVKDGRNGDLHWHILANLKEEFKDSQGNSSNKVSLVYRQRNSPDQVLSTNSSVEVAYVVTGNGQRNYETSWTADTGLVLNIAPGVKAETYSSTINWTLEDAP